MTISTCALYGGATYTNSWLGINFLVILTTFMIIAIVYTISSLFPIVTREKLVSAVRAEITQGVLSIVILVLLLVFAYSVCNISASFSASLTPNHAGMNPFQYADYYVGNLSLNTGLNLLTNIYSTSVSYAIEAQVLTSIGAFFNSGLSFGLLIGSLRSIVGGLSAVSNSFLSLGIAAFVQLSTLFSTLSSVYLSLSAVVTVAVGILFIQFLIIPVLQYTAFTIILPVAIAMRSLSFLGTSLRSASNSVLAIAIAAYLIYPVTIAFNGYAIGWIFSAQNPSFVYLHQTYIVPNIPVSQFFGTPLSSSFGASVAKVESLVWSSFGNSGVIIWPSTVLAQARTIVNETAQFLFAAVVLMVIDIAITIGFAVGLTKALNGGVEGAGSFWSGV